jgi:3',5'-nucleoside bisphosphate phosphatase
MIDLHTHTTESDGTLNSIELIIAAQRANLEAIAITDHDTFAGYDSAHDFAAYLKIDLICGIEASAKFQGQSVHILGYFLGSKPSDQMRLWVKQLQQARHARNEQLVERLGSEGLRISLSEVYERGGKLPGRPHFAALLADKGYVKSPQQAFEYYLGETAVCFVSREEPDLAECVKQISKAGGLSSLAHPLRVTRESAQLKQRLQSMKDQGLDALEVYYSEHSDGDTALLLSLASSLGLAITGGSDFHGAVKPQVRLGTGVNGRMHVPVQVLRDLRRIAPSPNRDFHHC